MAAPDDDRIVEYERLNLLGKAVFLTGSAVRTTASLIDKALEHAADAVVEVEAAFKEGLDPNVEDAKILQEWDRPGREDQARGR